MDVVKQICTSAALMQHGRIVEGGRLRDILLRPGSLIARQLFPLGEAPRSPGTTVLDLTFTELTAQDPVIARLAREQGLDVGLLGAAIETIDGEQTGRTRLALPSGANVDAAVASLQHQGIVVEVVA
ncbi:NIL domain-containing protein [Microbacterium amylolyticum]